MLGRRPRTPDHATTPEPIQAPPRRPPTDRQCAGTARRTGGPCGGWAVHGTDRCRTHTVAADTRHTTPAALTASVGTVQLSGVGWQTFRIGSREWQDEGWRLYDITGPLRFVANWVGHSVSRCRLYVAEVNDNGDAGNEAEDPDIAALAAVPLGQGPAKDEALRLLGVDMFVPGEAYIVAQSEGGPGGADCWFVVTSRQIRRSGGRIVIRRPLLHGGGEMEYRPDVDLILRVWTPHPDETDEADSPTRSAIPYLRELEAILKREFAELDSRLAGAGLLFLPQGLDFPRSDDDPPGMGGTLDGFMARVGRTMGRSMQDRSSAEAMVPLMLQVPADLVDKIKHLTFWSELSEHLLPMKTAAIVLLAQSLDIPAEILLGQADSNHWSAWQISEDAISTQIVPVLSRIADALTTGYLRTALELLGVDPDRYVYQFDTSPLTVRPNRTADALSYYDQLLISADAAREAGAFRDDQAPGEDEVLKRIAVKAVLGAPSLLSDPSIRALIGIEGPPPAPDQPTQPAPAPEPAPGPAPAPDPKAIPQQPSGGENAALIAVSGAAVRRALTLAGIRLVPCGQRDRWPDLARYLLHAKHGPIGLDKAEQVLRGAWEDLPAVAEDLALDPGQLQRLLHGFTCELLTRGQAYDPWLLRDLIDAAMRGRRLHPMIAAA